MNQVEYEKYKHYYKLLYSNPLTPEASVKKTEPRDNNTKVKMYDPQNLDNNEQPLVLRLWQLYKPGLIIEVVGNFFSQGTLQEMMVII